MERNVGRIDQTIRIALGLSLAVLARFVFENKVLAIVSYIVGGLLVITGVARFCSVYKFLGFSTSPKEKSETAAKEPERRRTFRRTKQSHRRIPSRSTAPAEQ